MAQRVLFCGDRNWNDYNLIVSRMRELVREHLGSSLNKGPFTVIEGHAAGADWLAYEAALHLKKTFFGNIMEIKSFPAKWGQYKKAAGPIRNQQMLDEGKPDLVIAFHDDLENSKGTKDMVNRAKKAGIPVQIVTH